MCLETRSRRQQGLFSLGLALLAIANTTHFFLQRSHRIGEDSTDGIFGMMIGAAIGVLIVALYRQRRAR